MGSRGGPRSSALDRAMAHLSGQRFSNTGISKDKRDVVSVYVHSCSTELYLTFLALFLPDSSRYSKGGKVLVCISGLLV